jgi:hypothetical protein
VHKFSIVAAVLPPAGGRPEVIRIETTEKAIRRFIKSLGGLRGWRSAMRRAGVGSRCGDCSARWGWRAM